jgi:hypothetical protein
VEVSGAKFMPSEDLSKAAFRITASKLNLFFIIAI